jgi:hypothetical protein
LNAIGAREIDEQWIQDLSGIRYPVAIFSVEIHIGQIVLYGMDVVGRNQISEVIIGRDVLNQLIVLMNGLAYTTEIQN